METISFIILVILGILLVIFNLLLWMRLRKFEQMFKGDKNIQNKNLESYPGLRLERLDKEVHELYEIMSELTKISKRGLGKLGIVRFNAFGEKSGHQSFAVAFLNWKENGFILSNIQTVAESRLYIREIRAGKEINGSKLLDEEEKALEKAKQGG